MKKSSLIILVLIVFTSCDTLWMEDLPSDDYLAMFDTMWQEIDDHYVFFDQKDVNWSSVGTDYRNQINATMNDEEFFDVLSGALSELQDGHVSLFSGFNTWMYHDLYLNYYSNFNMSFIERTYLKDMNSIGSFVYDKITPEIGYMYYESFGDDFTYEELDYLMNTYFRDTKGLIIDVRDNLGGAADNVTQLMSVFISEEFMAGKTFTPTPDGDLLEDEVFIKNEEGINPYTKQIAILTNRACYSSCNVFVGFMSQLENVTIVGDTTGGGSGLAVASELANGWKYRYSAAKITLANGTEIENGVSPDVTVSTGPADEISGEDAIIKEAISILQ